MTKTRFRDKPRFKLAMGASARESRTVANLTGEEWIRLVQRDYTSSLADRLGFQETITARLADSEPSAVLLFEIGGLATLESRLGDDLARHLRERVAEKLSCIDLRPNAVARLNDETFALFLAGLNVSNDAESDALRLISTLQCDFSSDSDKVSLSISVGVAHSLAQFDTCTSMVRAATKALSSAKAAGGNVWRLADRTAPAIELKGRSDDDHSHDRSTMCNVASEAGARGWRVRSVRSLSSAFAEITYFIRRVFSARVRIAILSIAAAQLSNSQAAASSVTHATPQASSPAIIFLT